MNRKLSEDIKVIWANIDPSTSNTLVGDTAKQVSRCIDVSKYGRVMCILFRTTGTGSILDAKLYAATDVAGTGLTAITSSGSTKATGLLATAGGTIANAGVGQIVLEANAAEIDATLADANFVAVKAAFATGGDELGVCWILSDPRYASSGLTATGNA